MEANQVASQTEHIKIHQPGDLLEWLGVQPTAFTGLLIFDHEFAGAPASDQEMLIVEVAIVDTQEGQVGQFRSANPGHVFGKNELPAYLVAIHHHHPGFAEQYLYQANASAYEQPQQGE